MPRAKPPPYRRGRCAPCTGIKVGDLTVCCGDCDRFPCECPQADDADLAWLGPREAGFDTPTLDRSAAA